MTERTWTFESLAQASRPTVEQILVASKPPDLQHLDGYVYEGYNYETAWYIRLPAKKFRKAFFPRTGMHYGLNQLVHPDDNHLTGEWRVQVQNGKPIEGGFFKVAPVSERLSKGRFAPYKHLIGLDYNVDLNPQWNLVMRAIYDIVGLPNEGDYSLILGKAYLCVLPAVSIFASYFVLGHPKPYERT